jgi:DNA-binding NtrC family response regulator
LHPDTRRALLSHPWPGNVRELRNTIERVCYLCNEDEIMENDLMLSGTMSGVTTHHLPQKTNSPSHVRIDEATSSSNLPISLSDATREFQVSHIDRAIAECNGNMTDAAARLGLHRSNLYRKMRQLGMQTSGE